MQKRLVLKYVLTQQGYNKVTNALDKEGVATNNRVQWLVVKTESSGSRVGKDKIRDIIVKRIAVKESLIEAIFRSLRLHGEIEVDWVLFQQDEVEPQRILHHEKNHKILICDLAQSDHSQLPIKSTNHEFIGRDRDFTNLANLSRQAKIVLIKAGAGVGKSTLAREFLQTRFKKVIRIEMGLESGNVTPAEEKVSQILRKEFDEEPSRDFGINLGILGEKLADRSNPIGVLIDNLEPALDENYRFREKLRGYDALLAVLGDRDVCSFTLITSRRSLIATRAKVHEYSLEGLDITAWRQYFHDCENGGDSEALLQMRDAYNGNAKVMDILHGAIKNRFDGNIGAYWSRYKDALLADSELETLISVEMDWLRDNQPDAYKLLCRMGCYRYQDIKTVPFEGLICLLWDVAGSRKACVIDYLSKTSLIEIKVEYYLHPAIRDAAKSCLLDNENDWRNTNQRIAEFWTESVENVESIDDALTAFEGYYHYLEIGDYNSSAQIINCSRENKWASKVTKNYSGERLGYSFLRLGLLEKSISSIDKILDKVTDLEMSVYLCNNFGDILWLSGNLNQAVVIHKKTCDILNRIKSFDKKSYSQPDIYRYYLSSLLNVGLCNLSLNNIEIAESCFEELLESSINNLFNIPIVYLDTYTANAEFCLALTKSINLDLKNTLFFIERLKVRGFNSNRGSWSKGWYLLFIGHAYKNIKYFADAFKFYHMATDYAIESEFSNVEGIALCGIGECNRLIKNNQESLMQLHKSVKQLTKIDAKCDLAEAYFQLGLTYQAMGEHDKAKEYKAKAIELFAQMEAPKQTERVKQAFEQGAMK